MSARRRRRRRLERKYMVRRITLLLIPIVLIVGIVLFVKWQPGEGAEKSGLAPSSSAEKEEDTEPTDATRPTQPPTEPEPEPEPVAWNLLLVNSQHKIPDGFEDDIELEYLTGEFQVDRRIVDFYTEMSNAAKLDGVDLMVCSAYRSVERQTELFEGRKEEFLAEGMDEEEAVAATLQYTTRPGTSEHHTGLAIDIVTPEYQNLDEGYAETAAARWLVENAAEYGFILRYPKGKESLTQVDFEPWHYRYVGEEAAAVIMEEGYCLEEYFMQELRQELSSDRGAATPDDEPANEPDDEPEDEPEE